MKKLGWAIGAAGVGGLLYLLLRKKEAPTQDITTSLHVGPTSQAFRPTSLIDQIWSEPMEQA